MSLKVCFDSINVDHDAPLADATLGEDFGRRLCKGTERRLEERIHGLDLKSGVSQRLAQSHPPARTEILGRYLFHEILELGFEQVKEILQDFLHLGTSLKRDQVQTSLHVGSDGR